MRVLVIGGGGREHALCMALWRDPDVDAVICAPGNAGIELIADVRPLPVADPLSVAALAEAERADLVVVGPEAPLVAGVADELRRRGITVFGPDAAAARLEGSKSFAKEIMAAAGVPTARAESFAGRDAALAHLETMTPPYVVKFDGLAAGKGVTVTGDLAAARAAVESAFQLEVDVAGAPQVVLEDYLDGPEVSLFAVTDGTTVLPLLPAQDSKRVGDDDTGPNTGGMGAYAPVPWAPPDLVDDVLDTVLQPTVDEMARRGTPFSGLLYAGLALTRDGVRVVEFNARFGDPEAQAVLALLETPLAGLLHAAGSGRLAACGPLRWRTGAAVTVVLAAPGYPEAPRTGDPIDGLDAAGQVEGVDVLHAGTRRDGDTVVSSGGRVLSVTAVGADLARARESAYAALEQIRLPGGHARTDIALRAVRGEIAVPT